MWCYGVGKVVWLMWCSGVRMSGVNVMWCWVSGEWDAAVLGQWCDTVVLGEWCDVMWCVWWVMWHCGVGWVTWWCGDGWAVPHTSKEGGTFISGGSTIQKIWLGLFDPWKLKWYNLSIRNQSLNNTMSHPRRMESSTPTWFFSRKHDPF